MAVFHFLSDLAGRDRAVSVPRGSRLPFGVLIIALEAGSPQMPEEEAFLLPDFDAVPKVKVISSIHHMPPGEKDARCETANIIRKAREWCPKKIEEKYRPLSLQ